MRTVVHDGMAVGMFFKLLIEIFFAQSHALARLYKTSMPSTKFFNPSTSGSYSRSPGSPPQQRQEGTEGTRSIQAGE